MASRYTPPGSWKSVEDFRHCLQQLSRDFDCDTQLAPDGPLSQPIELNAYDNASAYGGVIGNRFAIHPMEGWDGTVDGSPTEHTLRRWRRFGESGAKLIWGGEAIAVLHDGRANANQLFHNPAHDNVAKFRRLRETVLEGHRSAGDTTDDLLIGLQLTHSGRFAKPNGPRFESRIAYRHPLYNEKFHTPDDLPVLTDQELQGIRDAFIAAAVSAAAAGFQFVDIKCCHGYLLHELLSAHTRDGQYGGSFENRTRLFREIIEGILETCPGLEIGTRLGLTDLPPFVGGEDGTGVPVAFDSMLPYPYGFGMNPENPLQHDYAESFELLKILRGYGVRLLNISIGTPYSSPHLQRPATFPPSDGYLPPQDPLLSVFDQLQAVRQVKSAFPDFVTVGSGYSYLQDYLPHVAQFEVGQGNVDLVGLGRMVLSYPELPRDVLAGNTLRRKLICRTFSDCTTGPRNSMISGCFPLDSYYKQMPEAVTIKELRRQTTQRLQGND